VASFAWDRKAIVVVLRLSQRPEHWIDNPYITRIQLEKPRERTIGFGGGEHSSQELISALRQALQQNPAPAEHAPQPGRVPRRAAVTPGLLTAVPKKKSGVFRPSAPQAVIALSGICAALVLLLLTGRSERLSRDGAASLPISGERRASTESSGHSAGRYEAPNGEPSSIMPSRAGGAESALNAYPPAVRDIVLRAFHEPETLIREMPGFAAERPPTKSAPQSSAENTETQPPYHVEVPQVDVYTSDVITLSSEEIERQREILRQNFLEAVARAKQRQEEEEFDQEPPYGE
jgi:hypothetical protein